ncbi:MAG: hypothetical protein HGA19_05605 [Oscillochloris sp.]|nr:hypothetical protein [Oscillochloris sp.]
MPFAVEGLGAMVGAGMRAATNEADDVVRLAGRATREGEGLADDVARAGDDVLRVVDDEARAVDEITDGATAAIREEGGIANTLIPGMLPGDEVARHQRALKQFKVEVEFDRPLNEFDPMTGKGGIISLRHSKKAVPRGVFFEEVQHALDWHSGNRWSLPHRYSPQFEAANTRVHIGTFRRMASNWKRFGLTEGEVQKLLQQAYVWEQQFP